MNSIPERDWKNLRSLQKRAMNDACARIFEKVAAIEQSRAGREHEAYLDLWRLLRKEDEPIAKMFDDLRRSNAVLKLTAWRLHGILTDDDLTQFSEETQAAINRLMEVAR